MTKEEMRSRHWDLNFRNPGAFHWSICLRTSCSKLDSDFMIDTEQPCNSLGHCCKHMSDVSEKTDSFVIVKDIFSVKVLDIVIYT